MPKQLYIKNANGLSGDGESIFIEDAPFASGGEGDLYRVVPEPGRELSQVVKIYKPEKQTREKEQKLQYLIDHPPQPKEQGGHQSVVWVKSIVYMEGRFVGFVMPFARGIKLEMLCTPKLPKTLGKEWHRFDFTNPEAMRLRMALCFNIAAAVYQVHATGSYVLTDLKPENVIIQPNGIISLVDMDSVQVIENFRILFPATAATPEFTPPEYYKGVRPEHDMIEETWDRFSLAVIFYKLLLGIHPFTGNNHKQPYHNCQTLADMIEHGLFPFGSKAEYLGMVPPPHAKFRTIERGMQSLFIRCFDQGHQSPFLRPTADEWCSITSPRQFAMVANRALPSAAAALPSDVHSGTPIGLYTLPALPQLKQHVVQVAQNVSFKELSANRWFLIMVMIVQIITVIQSNVFPYKSGLFFLILSAVITWLMYLMNVDTSPRKKAKANWQQAVKTKTAHERAIKELKDKLEAIPESEPEIAGFIDKHNTTLQEEKAAVAKIIAPFNEFTARQDAAYKALAEQETAELQKAEAEFTKKMSEWQGRMEEFYKKHLQPLEIEFREQDRAISGKIGILQEEEKQERIKLMQEAEEIKKQIQELELIHVHNRNSGAFFLGSQTHDFTREIEVGEAREQLLERKEELQERYTGLAEVYARRKNELTLERAALQEQYAGRYGEVNALKADLNAEQNALKQQAVKTFEEIRKKYDALYEPLVAETKAFRDSIVQECRKVNQVTTAQLEQHSAQYNRVQIQKLLGIDRQNAAEKHKLAQDLITAMHQLDSYDEHQAKLLGELKGFDQVNFVNYVKKLFFVK